MTTKWNNSNPKQKLFHYVIQDAFLSKDTSNDEMACQDHQFHLCYTDSENTSLLINNSNISLLFPPNIYMVTVTWFLQFGRIEVGSYSHLKQTVPEYQSGSGPRPPLQLGLSTVVWSAPECECCIHTCPKDLHQEGKRTWVRFSRTKQDRCEYTLSFNLSEDPALNCALFVNKSAVKLSEQRTKFLLMWSGTSLKIKLIK